MVSRRDRCHLYHPLEHSIRPCLDNPTPYTNYMLIVRDIRAAPDTLHQAQKITDTVLRFPLTERAYSTRSANRNRHM